MKKIFLLILLLFGLFPFSAFSQQNNGIQFRLTPGAIIPIGDSADRYGIGISADFEGEYYLPFAPTFFALGDIGIEQSKNTITDKELSLLSAGGGAGFALSPFSRLILNTSACGGYYFSMYDDQTGGSAFLKSGANISFQFTPSFSMGLSGSYHHYFTGPEVFFQGIQASLGVSFNPAGTRGRSKIEFMDIRFEQVFPVFHTYYGKHPVGTITIKNGETGPIKDVTVSLFVKEYMANPTPSPKLENIPRSQERTIPLFALFGKNILEITEGTEASAEVTVEYTIAGTDVTSRQSYILPIERRNAMTWEDDSRAASFVTANDPAVLGFSKPIAAAVREQGNASLNDNFRFASAIFQGLSEYGIGYVVDPTTPYEELSENQYTIDFLQFPNETLTYRSGDCDDLSIMYSALLQAINIDTAFVTIPGHIYLAFALDLSPEDGSRLFSNPDNLIFRDGNTWIPVEITMFSDGFLKAWEYGAREWRANEPDGNAGFHPITEAWKTYRAVDSPFDDSDIQVPEISEVLKSYNKELETFIRRDIETRREGLEKQIKESNNNPRYINRLGVLYARYGLMDDAGSTFKQGVSMNYLPSINNLANLYYMEEDFTEALALFNKADQLSPHNPKIILGLARTNYELENYGTVKGDYTLLKELDPSLAEKFSYLVSATDSTSRAGSWKERRSPLWSEE